MRFLDHADRRIRRYIRATQKLIKLLEEQKQAIIHRAVTRGLDPNVRLKPSGLELPGDVPEHWHVVRLKYLIEGRLGKVPRAAEAFKGCNTGAHEAYDGDLESLVRETSNLAAGVLKLGAK